jgi:hypothetical protein
MPSKDSIFRRFIAHPFRDPKSLTAFSDAIDASWLLSTTGSPQRAFFFANIRRWLNLRSTQLLEAVKRSKVDIAAWSTNNLQPILRLVRKSRGGPPQVSNVTE